MVAMIGSLNPIDVPHAPKGLIDNRIDMLTFYLHDSWLIDSFFYYLGPRFE